MDYSTGEINLINANLNYKIGKLMDQEDEAEREKLRNEIEDGDEVTNSRCSCGGWFIDKLVANGDSSNDHIEVCSKCGDIRS
jgi:hypothetical protein